MVSRTAALLYGTEIAPSQFASIRKGDERAYMRGRRLRIILVPALSAIDLTARAHHCLVQLATRAAHHWPVRRTARAHHCLVQLATRAAHHWPVRRAGRRPP